MTKQVLLASSRGCCAGVDRAIETVENALANWGPPVYVRHQIVHNTHVIAALEARGAVFVDDVADVPEGARVIFSAHGVSPVVRTAAAGRRLEVVDATCPLVSKVHKEAVRFAGDGYTVLLIGHAGHEEIVGIMGEAPESIRLVESTGDAAAVEVPDPGRVVWLCQTTLAIDEAMEIVDVLRDRFPALADPPSDDICFATQNRQNAIKSVAPRCDVVLVVGSPNSSNSRRLVEVAAAAGAGAAHLVDGAGELDPAWLAGAETIGVTSGASVPEVLVTHLLDRLAGLGFDRVETGQGVAEPQRFSLPLPLRTKVAG
ncbi:4-hydroxy-3-methylbut-2-enyl diphosphate reductase [Saccharopolyspora indica]|uniref:4-hydroxy-3-methylbut-2-enyl diphosphate reductase n=1 Tax=Saccharopolyspora indica TaxID=1229659 RepID=UPI0022EA6C9C|nr:4-hydroxy-3-methylbut-2-enyl diphosphate reductase [Saccharopolyspora indica]MDA3642874.1 4-hydroxy-3-methylbut-2-enyl diphosphate reductase [Saccharopolyspora indica]